MELCVMPPLRSDQIWGDEQGNGAIPAAFAQICTMA
jgi:hypothetical protein